MPSTASFLEAILPGEGLKCAFVLPVKRHFFFPTAAELADFLLVQDGLGNTVYHACATYKTAEGRTKDNVLAARSLWLDVDAGEGKPYTDSFAAAEAVQAFCTTTGLPLPLFVSSGRGLHVYWPLDQSLDPKEWKTYADGLKSLTRSAGLQAGAERTSDIASILRPPGSHHRKSEPALVRAGPLIGPFALGDFAFLRGRAARPGRGDSLGAGAGGAASGAVASPARGGLTAAVGAVYEPVFADPIADQCAQVGAVRDSGGNVPEPHWYAALGVLAFCEDGEAKAQEWSSGYEGYSEAETAKKFERATRLSGATTCQHFADSISFDTCRTCPFYNKINSPISLGKGQWSPQNVSPLLSLEQPPSPSVSGSSSGTDLPSVPAPFAWAANGQLVFLGEKAGGDPFTQLISEHPIYLESVQRGEVNTGKYSYAFKQYHPHQGWLSIAIDAKALMGPNGVAELTGGGASIHDKEKFKQFVVHSVDSYNKDNAPLLRYEQFGWKLPNSDAKEGTAFLCGSDLYSPDNTIHAVTGAADDLRMRAQWLGPTKGGSLGVWSETIGELFSHKGFEPHAFVLLCSFGAPLMRFNSETEGGAIVSLVSGASGTGKSTALEAAGSIWGQKRGTDLTEIDTGVSKAITLATLGNLPAVFDELSKRDPEYVRDFVLMFTNGRDKMRGTTEGTIKHVAATWQTLLLTASNLSLVDTLNTLEGTDAPSFRVLELPAEMGDSVLSRSRAEQLKKSLFLHGGHAGAAYLRYIVQEDVRAMLPRLMLAEQESLWEKTALSSQHRFWVRALTAAAVAARIVERLKIVPFDSQRIIDWAIAHVKGEKHATATITGKEHSSAEVISKFLMEHINTMLVVQHAARVGRQHDQVPLMKPIGSHLFIRFDKLPGNLYIAEQVFKQWAVKRGFLVRDVIKQLMNRGIVRRVKMVTLGAGTDYPTGQVSCIEIDAHHPAVSGMLTAVSSEAEKERKNYA